MVIGSPGVIDSAEGIVSCASNLNWSNVNVTKKIAHAFNLRCNIANDVNVAALAEDLHGAGRGKKAQY